MSLNIYCFLTGFIAKMRRAHQLQSFQFSSLFFRKTGERFISRFSEYGYS